MATEENPITRVLDHELLFRSVKDSAEHHRCGAGGKLVQLCQSAFNDPQRKPSVDRVVLRGEDAQASRRDKDDGVVSLGAGTVRSIAGVVTNDKDGKPKHTHNVDVVHVPVDANYSHAQIETAPHAASDGAWKKLKEALCRIATVSGWSYPPQSARN